MHFDLCRDVKNYDELWQKFTIDVPEHFNFGYDIIDSWAQTDRNKLAMVWVDPEGREKKYTFHDLRNLSNEAANILIKYGIGRGDRVLLMLHRVPAWWVFVIALIKLGAIVCPSPTMLTTKDLEYRLNVGKFTMIITDKENSDKVEKICRLCPTIKHRMLVDGELPHWISYQYELLYPAPVTRNKISLPDPIRTRKDDPMLIYFTSGTTGEAKMVLHNHAHPLGHLVTAGLWQTLHGNDLHFTSSDTGWAKCGWGKIFGQWIIGACVLVYDVRGKFNATELLPIVEKYEITTFCCPPTIYRMLIIADLAKYDLRSLRHCTSAGEPLNPDVNRIWEEETGLAIYEGYGQSETCCCIATLPFMEHKPGSMGRPLPGWDIELHDDEGKPVGIGDEGRIAIKLDPWPIGLFTEYIDNDEANSESFQNGFYYTGDKAYLDEDRYFWFVGRNDDVIKSSGYRIGPFEVESALQEFSAVQESAVVGSPDPIRGTIVKAFIVLKQGYTPSEQMVLDIQKHAKRITAPYKYPREIEFVEELPKTISGKIKRAELRERELEKYRQAGAMKK